MLSLGSSEQWPKAMKMITKSDRMSASPLIEYFSPLFHYIDQQIKDESIGWSVDGEFFFGGFCVSLFIFLLIHS